MVVSECWCEWLFMVEWMDDGTFSMTEEIDVGCTVVDGRVFG